MGRLVVIGNQKGGVGKSTLTIHMVHAWILEGKSVAVFDLDNYQETTKCFYEYRKNFFEAEGIPYKSPFIGEPVALEDETACHAFCQNVLQKMVETYDIVIVDTPANDLGMNRILYSYSDTLLTPMNDSLIDLEGLAYSDPHSGKIMIGKFAGTVFESKMLRAQRGILTTFQWIVVRNRLAHAQSKNNQVVFSILSDIQKRIGCVFIDGLFERVIFRELFDRGLTVFDFFDKEKHLGGRLSLSHIAARQEVRNIISLIK